MRRAAVAATAAIVLHFREGRTPENLEWARDVLRRAILLPEKPDLMWSPMSVIPWHQAIFVARGLAADLRVGTAAKHAARKLLGLIAHPLEVVSLAALEEACKLWLKDPRLTWAALILAFSLCYVPPRPQDQLRQHGEALHPAADAQTAVDAALAFYENGSGWDPLPLPPPAWVKVDPAKARRGRRSYNQYDLDVPADGTEAWGEPEVYWHSKHAAQILKHIPFDGVLTTGAKGALLDFLARVLDWTNQKNAPPWVKPGRRGHSATRIFEWTHALRSKLGHVAGLLSLGDFQARFLDPILGLEDDNCWALLSPFTRTYVCAYVYDAQVVPATQSRRLISVLDDFSRPPPSSATPTGAENSQASISRSLFAH